MMGPGDYQGELEVDNLRRTYCLHIPHSYDASRPTPLVLAFHGRWGTGRQMAKLTNFSGLAEKRGFVVVYPDGFERSWNAGHGTGKAEAQGVDDVKFTARLIDALRQTLNLDGRRVYATGFSNGATLVQRLACELSDRIAAIAAVSGTIAPQIGRSCHPKRPVAVLQIHGSADPFVPWEGGRTKGGGLVESVAATVAGWVARDQCAPQPEGSDLGGGVVCTAYRPAGAQAAMVVVCRVERGGHTWPGGDQYLPEKVIGATNRSWNASEAIWDFFLEHSLHEPGDPPAGRQE